MARLKPTAGIKHPLRINKENVWDRKKALKHCVRKLRHIEDPETQLHQAVLLNNTLQRIRTMTSEPRVLQPASSSELSTPRLTSRNGNMHGLPGSVESYDKTKTDSRSVRNH